MYNKIYTRIIYFFMMLRFRMLNSIRHSVDSYLNTVILIKQIRTGKNYLNIQGLNFVRAMS